MKTKLHIRDFTDPTCPFAYSLEPIRWRLKWLYGNQLEWQSSMIVLSETVNPDGYLTPTIIAKNYTKLRDRHGMPIEDSERPRLSTSVQVCRAYIAALLNAPKKAERVLRELRIATMAGGLPDDPKTVTAVIKKCDIDKASFNGWLEQPAVETKLRADMQEARKPSRTALALKHKLGDGGKRYSAGSYIFSFNNAAMFELPGFWPFATYEAASANVAPELFRSPDPSTVQEVLQWANEPLATIEVATVMNQPIGQVRSGLEKIAAFTPLGQDGFWSLST
jgi:predicted DsbA family dithiol-disulfide isomerase